MRIQSATTVEVVCKEIKEKSEYLRTVEDNVLVGIRILDMLNVDTLQACDGL